VGRSFLARAGKAVAGKANHSRQPIIIMQIVQQQSLVPPLRFGRVSRGILRGGYPVKRNFMYLQRLSLKTIVCLTPEAPTQDLVDFAKLNGITLVHIAVPRFSQISNDLRQSLLPVLALCVGTPSSRQVPKLAAYFGFGRVLFIPNIESSLSL